VIWSRLGGGEGGLSAGFDDANDRDGQGTLDIDKGESGGGVARDHEEVGTLPVEELCAGDGVAGDRFVRLGAVGEAGGVAEVDVASVGDEWQQSAEDGEAAEAGVEYAYGGVYRSQLSVLRSQLVSVGGAGLAVVSVAG
jgi:hypothetical protein